MPNFVIEGKSDVYRRAVQNTQRKVHYLGIVKKDLWKKEGEIVYHTPSPFSSQTESILIEGSAGSGKTWVATALMQQAFFFEKRNILYFAVNSPFVGMEKPNLKFQEELSQYNLEARGIPLNRMVVLKSAHKVLEDVDDKYTIENYKVPIKYVTLGWLSEIIGFSLPNESYFPLLVQNENQGQIRNADMLYNLICSRTHSSSISYDQRDMICHYLNTLIDFENEQSVLINYLEKSTPTDPYWIAIDESLLNVPPMLMEIYNYTSHIRTHNIDKQIGITIENLEFLTRYRSCREVLHDLLYLWGRTGKIWRIFTTNGVDRLPHIFRDTFNDNVKGAYQSIIKLSNNPQPSFGNYINRILPRSTDSNLPYRVPLEDEKLKFIPPLSEVESF